MLRLDRKQPLPKLKRSPRKAEYVISGAICIIIANRIGHLMDSDILGVGFGQASRFYEVAIALVVGVWAISGAYGQYSRDMAAVSSYREVGKSGYLLGWRLFMTGIPVMSDDQQAQGEVARKTVMRAMSDRKGFLSLKGRSRRAADEWLKMKFHPGLTEDEKRCVPLWISWVILRDNHCG